MDCHFSHDPEIKQDKEGIDQKQIIIGKEYRKEGRKEERKDGRKESRKVEKRKERKKGGTEIDRLELNPVKDEDLSN